MRHCLASSAFLVVCFASTLLAQQGHVVGITGNWSKGRDPIHFGSQVSLDDQLTCRPGSTLMAAFHGSIAYGRCEKQGSFDFKKAAQASKDPGFLSRLATAVRPYGHRDSGTLITAVSRDFGR